MGNKIFRPPIADRTVRAPAEGGGADREEMFLQRLLAANARHAQKLSSDIDAASGHLRRVNGVLVLTGPVPEGDLADWIDAARDERTRDLLE